MATCSICSRPGARKIVDELLSRRVPLKQIAVQTGLKKSSIHRHSHSCVLRAAAEQLKNVKFRPQHDRVLVTWGNGSYVVQSDPATPESNGTTVTVTGLRSNDWVIEVCFAEAVPPREMPEPEEIDAPIEELSETLAADETFSDTPCEESILASPPEPTPTECTHDFREVAAGVTRCSACGEQKPVVQTFGVTRSWHDEQRGSGAFRGIFGRFG
jgi:ribosomal protein S14